MMADTEKPLTQNMRPDGSFLDGCPWDAIVMVDTAEVEKEVGVMPF